MDPVPAGIPLPAELVRRAKLRLLQMHFEAGVGHIGGNLSCLEILLTLYHRLLTSDDAFLLSKGHAAGAWYVALWSAGHLTDDQLRTFHQDDTLLSGHPPPQGIPQITFATGSLGHGLGLAAGSALAKRFKSEPGHVYCLTSDGEWNEGSCWESLLFIHHHRLDNLTIIVDANGLQGFGTTDEVAGLEPLARKLAAFGLEVQEVAGHDPAALAAALAPKPGRGPRVVLGHTHKGNGVSFMTDRLEWHYLPMTRDQYQVAVEEIRQARAN
jgi:transketolase